MTGVTIHYTATDPSASVEAIAAGQLLRDAAPGVKFPALAYHYIVDESGDLYWAHNADIRTYGSAQSGANASQIHVCYVGNVEPNTLQLNALHAAVAFAQREVGRALAVKGHKDGYATVCPGPTWPMWWT